MERRLAAILAADVVGYSRLIGADEEANWRPYSKARIPDLSRRPHAKHLPRDHRRAGRKPSWPGVRQRWRQHHRRVCERRRCRDLRGRHPRGHGRAQH